MKVVWTPKLWEQTCTLALAGKACDEIAKEIDLDVMQVYNRFISMRHTRRWKLRIPPRYAHLKRKADHVNHVLTDIAVPELILADRDRRYELRAQQDYTATFFGDPPPGYSALDQKQKTRAEASA